MPAYSAPVSPSRPGGALPKPSSMPFWVRLVATCRYFFAGGRGSPRARTSSWIHVCSGFGSMRMWLTSFDDMAGIYSRRSLPEPRSRHVGLQSQDALLAFEVRLRALPTVHSTVGSRAARLRIMIQQTASSAIRLICCVGAVARPVPRTFSTMEILSLRALDSRTTSGRSGSPPAPRSNVSRIYAAYGCIRVSFSSKSVFLPVKC